MQLKNPMFSIIQVKMKKNFYGAFNCFLYIAYWKTYHLTGNGIQIGLHIIWEDKTSFLSFLVFLIILTWKLSFGCVFRFKGGTLRIDSSSFWKCDHQRHDWNIHCMYKLYHISFSIRPNLISKRTFKYQKWNRQCKKYWSTMSSR